MANYKQYEERANMAAAASDKYRAKARRFTKNAEMRALWNRRADEELATYRKFDDLAHKAHQASLPPEARMEL